jgi:hypothetical protein
MEPSQKVLDALSRSELFRGLQEEDRGRVLALARPCAFADQALVVREDDDGAEIFLIVDGRGDVIVKVPFADAAQAIGQVRRGDVIGEVALVALGFRIMENVARLLAGRIRETNLKLRNTIASLLS